MFLNRIAVLSCYVVALLLVLESRVSAAFSEQGATILGGVNFSTRSSSLADFDNDGDLDLMFQHTGGVSYHRNNSISSGTPSFTFTDVTSSLQPNLSTDRAGEAWSAAWADYDGDGFVDVFVGQANRGSNERGDVLKNNGPIARFTNPSVAVGLNDAGFHQNVAWADMNNDRRLDLVIGMEGPEKHQIYLQDAAGQFTPVGAQAGLQVPVGTKSYGLAIGDSDGDGDLDMYVSTCAAGSIRNNFFKNMLKETGTMTFVDIADTNGTQRMVNTYGTEFVDFDNDNDLDLYVTGAMNDSTFIGEPTKIFRNDGNNMFTDIDTVVGHPLLSNTGADLNGGKAVDYDNDGDLDLYFHDNLTGVGYNHRLFRNDGGWQFTDVTTAQGLDKAFNLETVSGVPKLVQRPVGSGSYDGTWGDLDLDGDQDLIDTNNSTYNGSIASPERLYVSDASTNGNKWLYIDLAGPTWNTTGVGSTLFATMTDGSLQGVTLRREANTNAGTFNQSDLPVHFGLGTSSLVSQLLVQWPDGSKQVLRDVAANQYLTVKYLPGDYDGDGIVGSSDYVVWRKGLGTTYQNSDYTIWRANFGQSLAGAGQGANGAVPEPAALSLLLTAIPLLTRTRRR